MYKNNGAVPFYHVFRYLEQSHQYYFKICNSRKPDFSNLTINRFSNLHLTRLTDYDLIYI